jgi:predicted transglutaminase-like cysteine proteinase
VVSLALEQKQYKGVLSALKIRMEKNRLGELLVMRGHITQDDLEEALTISKATGQQLGRVLTNQKFISYGVIRQALVEQFAIRCMMLFMASFISFASMGTMAKQARAASIKDVPARIAFQQVSAYAPVAHYPKLFGSSEKQSTSLGAFTKWTGMFDRFDASLNTSTGQQVMNGLKDKVIHLRGQSIHQMAVGVNAEVNRIPYVNDINIYGKTDYWATPVEFVKNGGDCEDFAITKYVLLRALGVPEERLRIVILQDMQKNIPHAVLVVYSENGPMVLDNQIKTATHVDRISHYKPIFSINRDSWWLHTKPKGDVTVVAAAAQ